MFDLFLFLFLLFLIWSRSIWKQSIMSYILDPLVSQESLNEDYDFVSFGKFYYRGHWSLSFVFRFKSIWWCISSGYLLMYLTCFVFLFSRQFCVLTRLEFEIFNVLISSLRLIMVRNARYCVLCNISLLWL